MDIVTLKINKKNYLTNRNRNTIIKHDILSRLK